MQSANFKKHLTNTLLTYYAFKHKCGAKNMLIY